MSTIKVGEQVDSEIEYISDVDRYDVYLPGIKTYNFDVKGKPDGGGNWFYQGWLFTMGTPVKWHPTKMKTATLMCTSHTRRHPAVGTPSK